MKNTKMVTAMLTAGVMMAMVSGDVLADSEADRNVVGIVTENGYENERFGLKCTLPSDYTIDCRSAVQPADPQEMLDASNSDETIDLLATQVALGSATVFSASAANETDNMVITIEFPGAGYDEWDSEEVVAEGSMDSVRENMKNAGTEDVTVDNIDVELAQINFMGEEHTGLEYSCTMNDIPFYGKTIFLISDNSKFAFVLDMLAMDDATIAEMLNSFTKL